LVLDYKAPLPQFYNLTKNIKEIKTTNHAYKHCNARFPGGEEDEKEYQGLIIKERKEEKPARHTALSATEVNTAVLTCRV
jgi:hypothetical protein